MLEELKGCLFEEHHALKASICGKHHVIPSGYLLGIIDFKKLKKRV
jgi:hypothetical protein